MKEIVHFSANIPTKIIKDLYFPLKETFPGSTEDFNALLMYLGMIGSIALWESGLDLLIEKGKDYPGKDTPERREFMVKAMAVFLEEMMHKAEHFEDSTPQKQIIDFCENFRRNL